MDSESSNDANNGNFSSSDNESLTLSNTFSDSNEARECKAKRNLASQFKASKRSEGHNSFTLGTDQPKQQTESNFDGEMSQPSPNLSAGNLHICL